MRVKLLLALLALVLAGCTTPINVTLKDAKTPPKGVSGFKVGTLSPAVRKELGIKSDRAIIAVVSDGNLRFYGADGKDFNFNPKKPRGALKNNVTVRTYTASPECQEINLGGGFIFWYPSNCP